MCDREKALLLLRVIIRVELNSLSGDQCLPPNTSWAKTHFCVIFFFCKTFLVLFEHKLLSKELSTLFLPSLLMSFTNRILKWTRFYLWPTSYVSFVWDIYGWVDATDPLRRQTVCEKPIALQSECPTNNWLHIRVNTGKSSLEYNTKLPIFANKS